MDSNGNYYWGKVPSTSTSNFNGAGVPPEFNPAVPPPNVGPFNCPPVNIIFQQNWNQAQHRTLNLAAPPGYYRNPNNYNQLEEIHQNANAGAVFSGGFPHQERNLYAGPVFSSGFPHQEGNVSAGPVFSGGFTQPERNVSSGPVFSTGFPNNQVPHPMHLHPTGYLPRMPTQQYHMPVNHNTLQLAAIPLELPAADDCQQMDQTTSCQPGLEAKKHHRMAKKKIKLTESERLQADTKDFFNTPKRNVQQDTEETVQSDNEANTSQAITKDFSKLRKRNLLSNSHETLQPHKGTLQLDSDEIAEPYDVANTVKTVTGKNKSAVAKAKFVEDQNILGVHAFKAKRALAQKAENDSDQTIESLDVGTSKSVKGKRGFLTDAKMNDSEETIRPVASSKGGKATKKGAGKGKHFVDQDILDVYGPKAKKPLSRDAAENTFECVPSTSKRSKVPKKRATKTKFVVDQDISDVPGPKPKKPVGREVPNEKLEQVPTSSKGHKATKKAAKKHVVDQDILDVYGPKAKKPVVKEAPDEPFFDVPSSSKMSKSTKKQAYNKAKPTDDVQDDLDVNVPKAKQSIAQEAESDSDDELELSSSPASSNAPDSDDEFDPHIVPSKVIRVQNHPTTKTLQGNDSDSSSDNEDSVHTVSSDDEDEDKHKPAGKPKTGKLSLKKKDDKKTVGPEYSKYFTVSSSDEDLDMNNEFFLGKNEMLDVEDVEMCAVCMEQPPKDRVELKPCRHFACKQCVLAWRIQCLVNLNPWKCHYCVGLVTTTDPELPEVENYIDLTV